MEGDPCPQPAQLNTSMMEPCKYLGGYDYFHGSEVAYIYSCILLAAVPLICAGAGYAVVKLQNSRRRKFKMQQEENNNGKAVDKMVVKEWLHQNHKRQVKIKFGPNDAFYVVNRKGDKLRSIKLGNVDSIEARWECGDDSESPGARLFLWARGRGAKSRDEDYLACSWLVVDN
ncbi:unnamed protein product [Notodromas monacha]|uniref:Uncharacterized protein n=1 Tax=Notodromas monacha TaxID=399045 RepID=A0A7R9GKG4_9CRUS|nr:unnamed protein product [Notodromas monacha]CAG0924596.1 unnamed protein product [Notodromas monacha]